MQILKMFLDITNLRHFWTTLQLKRFMHLYIDMNLYILTKSNIVKNIKF